MPQTVHDLAAAGDNAAVMALIENDPQLLDAVDSNLDTCLCIASRTGNMGLVERLVEKECNLDHRNEQNESAVAIATVAGHMDITTYLAKAWCDLLEETEEGTPQIIFFTLYGNVFLVDMLLTQYQADVNAASKEGFTALMAASTTDNTELVELLLRHKANSDAINVDGDSALLLSIAHSSVGCARLLIEHGCDVNHKSNDGDTPLMICVVKELDEVAQLLLARGAHVNAVNADQLSALHMAAMMDSEPFVHLLLAAGADISLQSVRGETALDIAVEKGFEDVVRELEAAAFKAAQGGGQASASSSDAAPAVNNHAPLSTAAAVAASASASASASAAASAEDKAATLAVPKASKKGRKKKGGGSVDSAGVQSGVSSHGGGGGGFSVDDLPAHLTEAGVDAKIEAALARQQESFEHGFAEVGELLAGHMVEEMKAHFARLRGDVKAQLGVSMSAAGAAGGGRGVSSSPRALGAGGAGRKVGFTPRGVGAGESSSAEQLDDLKDVMLNMTLNVREHRAEMMEMMEGFAATLGSQIADSERRMQASLQQLKRSMQQMVVEVRDTHTTTVLADSAEAALNASSAIDEKYQGGVGNDGSSGSGGGGGDEVLQLLRQMRNQQLLSYRQANSERDDEMHSLRQQLEVTCSRLAGLESELVAVRRRSRFGADGLGDGGDRQLISPNSVGSNSGSLVPRSNDLVHDFSRGDASASTGKQRKALATHSATGGNGSASRGGAAARGGGGGGQRPVSPNTMLALAFLREEQASMGGSQRTIPGQTPSQGGTSRGNSVGGRESPSAHGYMVDHVLGGNGGGGGAHDGRRSTSAPREGSSRGDKLSGVSPGHRLQQMHTKSSKAKTSAANASSAGQGYGDSTYSLQQPQPASMIHHGQNLGVSQFGADSGYMESVEAAMMDAAAATSTSAAPGGSALFGGYKKTPMKFH